MTTRPGNAATQLLRKMRTKRLRNLVHIIRQDGVSSYFTDSDRIEYFEGNLYLPATFAGFSAERREAALRPGDQNLYGLIDGTHVVLQDLLGDRYRGAEVRRVVIDRQFPWLPAARHRRFVRTVHRTSSSFVAILESRTQVMTRPAGGRFKGIFAPSCTYTLGDPATCKAVFDSIAGVRIQTINDQKWDVSMLATTWPGSFVDDFYRLGEITWLWAAPEDESQVTATTTSTAITDATQSWTPGEHKEKTARILSGTNGQVMAYVRVADNNATQLLYPATSFMAGALAGTFYDICEDCDNVGFVQPVEHYRHAARGVEFYIPAPFNFAVGDSGIAKPGCDGLRPTCVGKFANGDNYGGRDHLAPLAGAVVEPPTEQ